MNNYKGLNEFMNQEVQRSSLDILRDIQAVINDKGLTTEEKDALINELDKEFDNIYTNEL